ncbi:gamma-glutamyltransferase family protein [Brevundimonas variabilis]|uniref:Gamma-glutamyltranspeptidase/glutathione hydrolase n=1 Tax=Brevundimonas variabilis TaxID=74312 RepID=A0A7W9CIT7_9CAUL|nr:gamma-glutamyltransferase family protein [Brevundimonas variabilis]MBB5746422.1 gamma-glutamyltranspeptidase/glutathione hydrolase [Brevundimonas variabilis]
MRRRTFLKTLPAGAVLAAASAASAAPQTPQATAAEARAARTYPYAGIGPGDRIMGAPFAGRSTVWGTQGAAATAHPAATLIGIDTLRRGGSAIDAAIAINAALGFLEPTANGIGGDAFCLMWDPAQRKVVGFNGSGNSPAGLSLATARSKAGPDGFLPRYGAVTVNVPGTVDAWWSAHQRYGKLPWKDVLLPVAEMCERGIPMPQLIAWYLERNMAGFDRSAAIIEDNDNRKRVYAPGGRTPRSGEVFANPDLGRTYRMIAEGGRDAFYDGPIADQIEGYFRRIGGWMTRADLKAHATEWVEPIMTTYRGVEVYSLGPNTQGLSTNQILNICEQFDLKAMGFQSAASIHHQAEAKRLAFEDRARWFADPRFARTPVEYLNSKAYAAERARLIRPDRVMERAMPGDAPTQGDTTYFSVADSDGMMVSWIQSNYRGMGSGLVPDGADGQTLGFMFQDRGELFALTDGHPNVYAPGKRPFHTIIPGFACKDGQPWMAYGVMGGGMQPQGQAQIVINMVDYGLDPQEAGDAPRWQHEGSTEPTGHPAEGQGVLHLETGVPADTRAALQAMGWTLGEPNGGFGGYQNVVRQVNDRGPWTYGAATEMRKDGIALAY